MEKKSRDIGILMSNGKGDHGKLGHGKCDHDSCNECNCTENKLVPVVVDSIQGTFFIKIDSLSTHSAAISSTGELFTWGNGDKYRLGHGTVDKVYAPKLVAALQDKVGDFYIGLFLD